MQYWRGKVPSLLGNALRFISFTGVIARIREAGRFVPSWSSVLEIGERERTRLRIIYRMRFSLFSYPFPIAVTPFCRLRSYLWEQELCLGKGRVGCMGDPLCQKLRTCSWILTVPGTKFLKLCWVATITYCIKRKRLEMLLLYPPHSASPSFFPTSPDSHTSPPPPKLP